MSTDQTTSQETKQIKAFDEDFIYTQLYEKGKVENYIRGGEPFSDATRLCLAQGLVDEETLKKYGSFAFRFIYDNMQTRGYPGDEGDAKKYLETLKTALKEKSPEELMKYTPVIGDVIAKFDKDIAAGEKTEEDKQRFIAGFLKDEQKRYKNFSEGHFYTNEKGEISRISDSAKIDLAYACYARIINTGQCPAYMAKLVEETGRELGLTKIDSIQQCSAYVKATLDERNATKNELKSEKDLSDQGITQTTSESAATDNANASQTALANQVDTKKCLQGQRPSAVRDAIKLLNATNGRH
jgi:tRNA isopentenyl-2-thiomethyl-A-37 hydroxylase MiaE